MPRGRPPKELEEENEFLRRDNEQLALQVRDLTNREYYLRQELLAIQDERSNLVQHPDRVHIGAYLGQKPGDMTLPCHLPLPTLSRSLALYGKQGAGKTNLYLVISPQLRKLGVRQLCFDKAGELRGLFPRSEILEREQIRINPFDDMGLWKDREISAFVKYTFFSFFNATNSAANNLGRIGKALHYYMREVPSGSRNLRNFLVYLDENKGRLEFPEATFQNIKGYIEGFLYDEDLAEVFDVAHSSPEIVRAIRGDASACIQVGQFPDRIRSVVATSILRHATRRMQRDFHEKASTQERPLTLFICVEETKDLVTGRAEQNFFEEQLRDSRKHGYGFMLFPRDDATMRDLGIDNILSVGGIFFFQNNESVTVRNPHLQKVINNHMFSLPPGRCIMYTEGRDAIVQTDRGYAIQE